ncbi:MAG: DUF3553 domain-containing protein [Pseudomonadota bacterium]
MNALLEPGAIVRNADQPDWGLGQVQSVSGERITVNFEHIGKVVVLGTAVTLEILYRDED